MKKVFAAAALAAFTTGGAALAADLPRRAAPPVLAPVPIFTWTGAYFGINAGYISTDRGQVNTFGVLPANAANVATGARPGLVRIDSDGFTGGGQIGYNYQVDTFVLGVEADIAYTDLDRTRSLIGTGGAPSVFRSSLDFLGTVRGRVGLAFDRVLVYGTGGFAYGDVENRVALSGTPANAGAPLAFFGRSGRFDTGYAAGGGIEYALPTDSFVNFFRSSAVTVKAEGLYYDLGRRTVAVNSTGLGVGAFSSRFETSGYVARIGLNYKFGTF